LPRPFVDRREFTWDVVARRIEDVYREALAA
jgi:hypothetical protein